MLLEVFGAFKLDDESRFVNDHVKAGYGLIAMLSEIAYTCKFASFDLFTSVYVFFLKKLSEAPRKLAKADLAIKYASGI